MNKKNNLSKNVIFSCFLASCLEIYDFVIFGFMSKIIHLNYLSFLDESAALIVSYAFLAVGFIFRPIGSIIFGYIGDVYGRKKSLILSVSMMGSASLLMFCLPSYSLVGIISCYVIVLVRIIQGISVGGEFTGAIIFAVEHNKNKVAGVIAGIVSAGGACGVLLASFVTKILQSPSLPEYSWRFAFLIGVGLSIVGYFIRKRISDTPVFKLIKKPNRIPLFEGFRQYKIESFAAMCIAAANGATFYFGVVYLGKYLSNLKPYNDFSFMPILVALTMVIFLPIMGKVSDIYERKKLLLISLLLMCIYSIVSIKLMIAFDSVYLIALVAVIYTIIAAAMVGCINILAIEMFPPQYRMSCSSLFYSLGMGFVGGTVPMMSSIITKYIGTDPKYIGGYIAAICFVALLSVIMVIKKQVQKEVVCSNQVDNNKIFQESYKLQNS